MGALGIDGKAEYCLQVEAVWVLVNLPNKIRSANFLSKVKNAIAVAFGGCGSCNLAPTLA